MKCSFCGCLEAGELLPRNWKVCGHRILCQECQRRRYRRKALTMAVEDPIGARWREFRAALEEVWSQPTPLLIPGREWELTIAENQPLVRVSIGERRWLLLLHCAKWSRGRRAAAEIIASGQAVARELLLYRMPQCRGRLKSRTNGDRPVRSGIVCTIVAWLPRKPLVDTARQRRPPRGRETRSNPQVRNQNIEAIAISSLRQAIRANWISFPSQAPRFPSCGRPDLQPKLVQLYFVQGWSSARIAARYGLLQQQVQRILKAWKAQAARAGYIQQIPPADAIPNWRS